MKRHHPKNERIKRAYRLWLQEAKQKASHSIDQTMAAIALFEASTGFKDFAHFHIEQARKFKRDMAENVSIETGKPLAKATVKARLDALKGFHFWLADRSGYRSKINHSDCEYFSMSANDARIATAKRAKPAPDLDQIHCVISTMKSDTAIEARNRALVAFTILTGARDNAISSFRVGDVDLTQAKVIQDARHVRTKFRKTFDTWFFPVGGDAETIVRDWIARLKGELKFGPDDPLFPQTEIGRDAERGFVAIGVKRQFWSNADAIRRIFKEAFEGLACPTTIHTLSAKP